MIQNLLDFENAIKEELASTLAEINTLVNKENISMCFIS